MRKLKPCPFCRTEMMQNEHYFWHKNTGCFLDGVEYRLYPNVCTAWDTRAEPAPPVLDWPEEPSEDIVYAGIAAWQKSPMAVITQYKAMREAHAKTKQPPKGDA